MKKRLLTCFLTAAFTLALLSGCSQDSSSSAPANADHTEENELTKVTLNEVAHSIFYAPMYVAVEEGYFAEEGIDLDLVCGFGADKTMTAVISGEADIGFMGSEASIYTYNEGATDYVVNFAQLTQRAGNFLVAREEMPDFTWEDLKGRLVLGGRKGGMPEMVFEYILKQNGIDPETDLQIDGGRVCRRAGRLHRRVRARRHHSGIRGERLCCGVSRRRQRLCPLHGIQCKEELYRRKS